MANKTTTKVTPEVTENLQAGTPIVASPVVQQLTPANQAILDQKIVQTTGSLDPLMMSRAQKGAPEYPVTESDKTFYQGVIPSGFSNTYGDEVTNVTDGQLGPVIESLKTIFKEEDGFRYFFKYVGNYIFTILVPLKYSDENESFFEVYRCHASSVVLRQGDVVPQIISHAKRVAQYIKYQRNR